MEIYVLCPSGSKTGGAECLHQLVDALRLAGSDAFISYVPDKSGAGSNEFFSDYNAPIKDPMDIESNLIVIYERYTSLIRKFKKAKKAVFWLSVDNYLYRKGASPIKDFFMKIRSLKSTRLPIIFMKQHIHLAQSEYSVKFLENYNIQSIEIGDYLNDDFFSTASRINDENYKKLDQVAYNPKKGQKFLDYVISKNPSIKFVPIINMSREEVVTLLAKSKLYIDLGYHPGKDRIPREAAVLGCCIITSKSGSAANNIDVPIPNGYKFDLKRKDLSRIPDKILSVFNNFEVENKKFDDYRLKIKNEKEEFILNSKNFISTIKQLSPKGDRISNKSVI